MTNSRTKKEYTTVGDLIYQLSRFDRSDKLAVWLDSGDEVHHPLIEVSKINRATGCGFTGYVLLSIEDGDPN